VSSRLSPADAAGFRAAGVVAFRRAAGGAVWVLLGRERLSGPRAYSGRLNLLGGKIDAGESAAQTAARECWEESGRLLDQRSLLQRVERSDVSWHPQAKYALHFLELSDDNEADVCERYAAVRPDRTNRNSPHSHLRVLSAVSILSLRSLRSHFSSVHRRHYFLIALPVRGALLPVRSLRDTDVCSCFGGSCQPGDRAR